MKKRLLSILFVLTMVFSMVPVMSITASAKTSYHYVGDVVTAYIHGNRSDSDAINNIKDIAIDTNSDGDGEIISAVNGTGDDEGYVVVSVKGTKAGMVFLSYKKYEDNGGTPEWITYSGTKRVEVSEFLPTILVGETCIYTIVGAHSSDLDENNAVKGIVGDDYLSVNKIEDVGGNVVVTVKGVAPGDGAITFDIYQTSCWDEGCTVPVARVIEPTTVSVTNGSETKNYTTIDAALKHGGTNASVKDTGESDTTSTKITLLDNIEENVTIPAGRNITLDLNGYVIKGDGSGSVITNNGTLTVKDSDADAEHYFNYVKDGAWTYYGNSEPTEGTPNIDTLDTIDADTDYVKVLGGCITGGNAAYGGAIRNKSTLSIIGGNLAGNTVTADGGAVRNGGTFTLSGGAILGCTAVNGGAVLNESAAASFTLSDDAMIAYCNATLNGGAIYSISSFSMEGGKIYGCTAKNGGGVFVSQTNTKQGTFTMSAGLIENCEAENNGGGVVNFSGASDKYGFEMTGGEITGCKAKYGGGVFANGDKEKPSTNYYINYTKLAGGTIKKNECTSRGGGVYFGPLTDSTLSGDIVIKNNKGNPEKYGAVSNLMTLTTVKLENIGNSASIGVAMLDNQDPPAVCGGAFTVKGVNNYAARFHSDSKEYAVAYAEGTGDGGYLELVEKKTPTCTYTAPFATGEQTLVFGKNVAGEFTVSGESCKGYTLKNADGEYLALVNGEVKTQSNSFTWKYDGGLYTETKTTCKTGFRFWYRPTTKATKQYLSFDGEKLVLSNCKVCAEVQVTADEHTYNYLHDGDGCHEAYCTMCGYHEEPKEHEYDETTHLCVCGKMDPGLCYVSDVKVTKKKTISCGGFWLRTRKTTKYQYTVKPETQNVCVAKVEYSGNGEKWSTGTVFTSNTKLDKFYIRVTDSNGKVTNWKYINGTVSAVQKYSITLSDTQSLVSASSIPEQIAEGETVTISITIGGTAPSAYVYDGGNCLVALVGGNQLTGNTYNGAECKVSDVTYTNRVLTFKLSNVTKNLSVTVSDNV